MSRIDDLYERFERRFRGSRSTILERLAQYAPLLELVEQHVDERRALDLGCGRGEWVELLKARGWQARGIDSNRRMIAEAMQYEIDVVYGNAVADVGTLPDRSVQLITAFHLVEHLPIETLLMLLREMSRVLAKDGVIILETPNPENLTVGTANFYLDPTHDKPLPPELLRFLLEQSGIGHTSVIRLNGETDPETFTTLESAMRPLFYRAFDYAVIGVNTADTSFIGNVDRFIAQVAQCSPVDLVGLKKLDEFLAARREEDRKSSLQAATELTAVIYESRDIVHGAVEAVYNTTRPMHEQLAAIETGQQSQTAHLEAIVNRLDVTEAGITTALAIESKRIEAAEASLAATLADVSKSIDEVQAGVAATWAQIERSARLLELSLRQELAAARRNSDAREFRHVAALEALRKTTQEATTRTDASQVVQAKIEMERRIAQATQEAIDRTTTAYTTSTSWRVTAPLRSLSDIVARRHVAKAMSSGGAMTPTPAKRGPLANRFIWDLGKRTVGMLPGLRKRVLKSMDRHDLLIHPFNEREVEPLVDALRPRRFVPFRTLEELDETTRVARMSPDTKVLYLQMVEAQARLASQR